MYPGQHAQDFPDKPAQIMASTGEVLTYRQLDDRSNRLAQLMFDAGLRRGDHIAVFMENHPRYLEAYWAAIRSGLYITTVSSHLSAEEAAYIVGDCEARVLISSSQLGDVAEAMLPLIPACDVRLMVDGARPGYDSYEECTSNHPAEPLAEQPRGGVLLYSSGTTGRPKGIWRPLGKDTVDQPNRAFDLYKLFHIGEDSVYLSPAPLYHAAAFGSCTAVQVFGGTVVITGKFDALESLRAIETYRVTESQWVPTMFSRMLKLPAEDRARFDLSSHRVAIHGAAPCPPSVKREMIEWWGPILLEHFGATEQNGLCLIDSETWLSHPGSVGKPVFGVPHICNEQGSELPTGEDGLIYFARKQMPFQYHKDDGKTKSSQHPEHPNWSTLGDIGHLDEEGFIYLTDRKSFMIISGGVNIYPAEAENALAAHPKVLDVAVIGVPNEEFGEEVKAVVELVDGVEGSDELASELLSFCRDQLAHIKCPRSVDFTRDLPRLPAGKLAKRVLRERYWSGRSTRIM